MKTLTQVLSLSLVSSFLFLSTGCSNAPLSGGESGKDISASGPTIMNVRTVPDTIELNKNLKASEPAQVVADVKDFRSNVSNVKLKFVNIPLELPMSNVTGTTWTAKIPPNKLKDLAVAGKTIRYDANIIARNENGQESTSPKSVTVTIKAPDIIESVS